MDKFLAVFCTYCMYNMLCVFYMRCITIFQIASQYYTVSRKEIATLSIFVITSTRDNSLDLTNYYFLPILSFCLHYLLSLNMFKAPNGCHFVCWCAVTKVLRDHSFPWKPRLGIYVSAEFCTFLHWLVKTRAGCRHSTWHAKDVSLALDGMISSLTGL